MPALEAIQAQVTSIPDLLAAAIGAVAPAQLGDIAEPESADGYRRVTLRRDEHLEVAAARWVAGGHSSLHGHGPSAATYAVISGVVRDERYIPDGDSFRCETLILCAGEQGFLPPGSYHMVRALEAAVTVHGYAPPPDHATEAIPTAVGGLLRQAKRRARSTNAPARSRPAAEQAGRR